MASGGLQAAAAAATAAAVARCDVGPFVEGGGGKVRLLVQVGGERARCERLFGTVWVLTLEKQRKKDKEGGV